MEQISASATKYIPALFVVLWSTGFVGAGYAMPNAGPFVFLSVRFILCILLIGGYALAVRSKWPTGAALWSALVTGALIHGMYLGLAFWAIKHGFPAGFAGLIVGLQPIITAVFAGFIVGERITPRQMLGLGIGLLGVGLVLAPKLGGELGPDTVRNALICFVGVSAFSLGTVLQKRFGGGTSLAAGTVVQYMGALALTGIAALLFEPLEMNINGELIFALLWLVFVLSIGAIVLLMIMIRAGEVARVASLFYLVPAVTAVMTFFLFGDRLNMLQIVGILVTSAGVALATLRRPVRLQVPLA